MTTAAWSTRIRHDSDAEFRKWGLELQTKLLAVGLVADEASTNWTTATRPGVNTEYGYEVYHLNDSLHATAPIYIRIGYGTASATTAPRIQVTIGTSTNGSGVLGGTALTGIKSIHAAASQTTDLSRPSYVCVTEGFFGLFWKSGAIDGFFAVCRTCDNTGTPNATGALVVWGASSVTVLTATQALRFAATAQAFTARTSIAETALGMNPQALDGIEGDSGEILVAVGWTITPEVKPLFGLCGVDTHSIGEGTTFQTTLVGVTARTYIRLGTNAGPFGSVSSTAASGLNYCMLWE
jgi:hypothetical protein